MTGIDLSVKDGSYGNGIYEVVVTREPFTESDLFYKTVHKPKTELSIITIKLSNIQIRLNHPELKEHPILNYTAYYSTYDDDIPLIFEIVFKNDKSKQFTYSELIRLKGRDQKVFQINSFFDITLEKLIQLNYRQNNSVVFRTEQKTPYYNVNVSHRDEPNGFKKYTHKHIKGIQKSNVLFDNNVLNVRENKLATKKLKNVQKEKFDEINVFYRTQYLNNPLLIELNQNGNKSYLTRKNNNDRSWTWHEITDSLENELESIETLLNYSIIVLIHRKEDYIKDQIDSGTSSELINVDEKISVSQNGRLGNYLCYKHDLSAYSRDRDVGTEVFGNMGLFVVSRLFICNTGIETYGKNEIEYLHYRKDQPLYVYFYNEDDFPLMVKYNNKYYTPKSKDVYFNTWVNAEIGNKVIDVDSMILHKLNTLNKQLNEIIINNTSNYNIPIDNASGFNSCFNISRITVDVTTYQYIFNKYKHTPKNYYSFNNMIFVNKLHKTGIQDMITLGHSVSVYYFNRDPDKRYPLVLELETPGRNFIYYFLKGENLTLEKFEKKDKKSIDQKELKHLLDHQNFVYNKLIDVKLEKQYSYTCCEKGESNLIRKRINENDNPHYEYCYIHTKVDNQKNFPIIHVETGVIDKPLKDNNFKRYSHHMGQFEIENEKTTTFALNLEKSKILIKAFTIVGKPIKLQSIDYLIERLEFLTNDIYVYFYGEDPRPLLLCVENKNYYPESIDLYFNEWFFLNNIKSGCKNPNYTKIVSKLKEVCYNLNPVKIDEKGDSYQIHHEFPEIRINIAHSILKCYKVFTHTANDGLKLGEIIYNSNGQTYKLFEDYSEYVKACKDVELNSVKVYYPICDENNQYPLLIQLNFKGGSEIYYELSHVKPKYKWDKLGKLPESTHDQLLQLLRPIKLDIEIKCCTLEKFPCNYKKPQDGCQDKEDESEGDSGTRRSDDDLDSVRGNVTEQQPPSGGEDIPDGPTTQRESTDSHNYDEVEREELPTEKKNSGDQEQISYENPTLQEDKTVEPPVRLTETTTSTAITPTPGKDGSNSRDGQDGSNPQGDNVDRKESGAEEEIEQPQGGKKLTQNQPDSPKKEQETEENGTKTKTVIQTNSEDYQDISPGGSSTDQDGGMISTPKDESQDSQSQGKMINSEGKGNGIGDISETNDPIEEQTHDQGTGEKTEETGDQISRPTLGSQPDTKEEGKSQDDCHPKSQDQENNRDGGFNVRKDDSSDKKSDKGEKESNNNQPNGEIQEKPEGESCRSSENPDLCTALEDKPIALAVRGEIKYLLRGSGSQGFIDDFITGYGDPFQMALQMIYSLLTQPITSGHVYEIEEDGRNFERITKYVSPSQLYQTSESERQKHRIPRHTIYMPDPPPFSDPPSGDNTSPDDSCTWISSGIVGSALVGIPPYPLYLYFERIRVRDMRAVF